MQTWKCKPSDKKNTSALVALIVSSLLATPLSSLEDIQKPVIEAGHPSLQIWQLPTLENPANPEEVELGRQLFFDTRLSGNNDMSCATCHNPKLGWSDGRSLAEGFAGKKLGRGTPSLFNTAYNEFQMWDGRSPNLEHQALLPVASPDEMNQDLNTLPAELKESAYYKTAFARLYPDQGISLATIAQALASFERTIVVKDTPFDRWIAGDAKAMTDDQVKGFEIFLDENKGNCAACHHGPSFSDHGFHNLGLASYGNENPDLGRYAVKPVRVLKGAFKTPELRNINQTAPYFHDGSAQTIAEVIEHYALGGVVKTNLSPSMKPLELNDQEKQQLEAFLNALNQPQPKENL